MISWPLSILKTAQLGQRLGSNYLAIHRMSDGVVVITASDTFRRATRRKPGPSTVREYFADSKVCELQWLEAEEQPRLQQREQLSDAW